VTHDSVNKILRKFAACFSQHTTLHYFSQRQGHNQNYFPWGEGVFFPSLHSLVCLSVLRPSFPPLSFPRFEVPPQIQLSAVCSKNICIAATRHVLWALKSKYTKNCVCSRLQMPMSSSFFMICHPDSVKRSLNVEANLVVSECTVCCRLVA